MLLAGGERQHEAALAIGIDRFAAQPARHLADELFRTAEQAKVRPAELQTDAQRLPLAHNDVGAKVARRFEQAERHRFRHHGNQQRAPGVGSLGNSGKVRHATENVGILDDDAGRFGVNRSNQCGFVNLCGQGRGAPVDHVTGKARHGLGRFGIVRVQPIGQNGAAAARDAGGHGDGLPAGGRAVIERGIGHVRAEQPGNLRLELEQDLQRPLGDFRLVGRIGREELATLDQVIDRGGNVVAIGPSTQEKRRVTRREVLPRQPAHMAFHGHFAGVERQAGDRCRLQAIGRDVSEKGVDVIDPDLRQHGTAIIGGERKIAHGDQSPAT